MTIIDAKGAVLGRLASNVAKRLLNGEEITVVNAEELLLSGRLENSLQEYSAAYNRGKAIRGPEFPRMPDRLFRRTVRGMLPFRTKRGRDAYRRLKVFIGVPKDVDAKSAEKIALAPPGRNYVKLAEVSRLLGAKVH
ncbi:MAG: 50S ribosomal protein L13 [Methanomassiliicoccales archaeon]